MKLQTNLYASVCLLLAGSSILDLFTSSPAPPSQPSSGPGGSQYSHRAVQQTVYGEGAEQFWVYEPSDPLPTSAPVIVFLHGWVITNPMHYGAWIDHLVRRGNIVIYPRYQKNMLTPAANFTQNALDATCTALKFLQSPGHVKPKLDKLAIVGHSAGAVIAANLAASRDFPTPAALMAIEPSCKVGPMFVRYQALSRIPKTTLVLVVVGDMDFITLDIGARQMLRDTSQIPRENKDYIRMTSDRHGSPTLLADHLSPFAWDAAYDNNEIIDAKYFPGAKTMSGPPDALDFYGYWKLLDGLTDAAFYGKNRKYALGNTPEQRFMGSWSDDVPVKELEVLEIP